MSQFPLFPKSGKSIPQPSNDETRSSNDETRSTPAPSAHDRRPGLCCHARDVDGTTVRLKHRETELLVGG
jgi:hypothetical protein